MADIMFGSHKNEFLLWIREGTPVYDREGSRIGTVRHVHPGDAYGQMPLNKPPEFYHLPFNVQDRLAPDGFIQIDCGFLAPNCIVLPNQVEAAYDECLLLCTQHNELISL